MLVSLELERNKEKYDCELCRKRKYYEDRNCTGEIIPKIVDEHTEDVRYVISNDLNIVLNYCPAILFYDEEINNILDSYIFYKDGHLPEEGGLSNQEYRWVKTILELKALDNYIEKKEIEKVSKNG